MEAIVRPPRARWPDRGQSPLTLLVVQDGGGGGASVVTQLRQGLLLEGHSPDRVQVASDVHDAVAQLRSTPPDAVVVDRSSADLQGQATVDAVRAAAGGATPVIVLTRRPGSEPTLWTLSEVSRDSPRTGGVDAAGLAVAVLRATGRRDVEQAVQRYRQLARGLLDGLDAPTCAVSADGVVLAVNEAWRRFMDENGGSPATCGEGVNYLDVCDQVAPGSSGSVGAAEVAAGLRGVLAGRTLRFAREYPCHHPTRQRWYSVRVSPVQLEGGTGALVSHVDVSAIRRAQQALTHQALHDALTGLPNRVLLADRLAQALADGTRRRSRVGVGFVDLDDFKRVNVSLGHAAGDRLLVQVATRLAGRLRAGDTLCRYSGDEFAVLWRDLGARDDLTALGERLSDALAEPFDLGHASVTLSASVGVALGGQDEDVEQLLLAASAAKVEAKRRGGGRVWVFSEELRRSAGELIHTEMALRKALARSELVLHYQPVMDLRTGRPVGVEALARWQHPARGLLGPGEFIALAEARGLAVPLGRWALEQACRDAAGFDGPARGLDVAVNLSARQLTTPDLLAQVDDALAGTGLPAGRLVLEVTESAVMTDEEAAGHTLAALSSRGVRIALDDFGTGYSSLLYLRRFPISGVKLDRTFVAGMVDSAADEAICASVVSLAHAVGATSVAEGVETPEQYATLRALGCQQAQGFLWSPAVPVEQLGDVLRACCDVAPAADAHPAAPARLHLPRVRLPATPAVVRRRQHRRRLNGR